MAKISKTSAPTVQDAPPALDVSGPIDDYTVNFVTIRQTSSLEELLKGLPDDRCQCPHWGYVFAGRLTVRYADGEEVYETGDAFYMSPGHVPSAEAGSEFLQFSPKDQLAETMAVIQANAARLMQNA